MISSYYFLSRSSFDVVITAIPNGKFPTHLLVNNKPNVGLLKASLKKRADANALVAKGNTAHAQKTRNMERMSALDIAVKTQNFALASEVDKQGCEFNLLS